MLSFVYSYLLYQSFTRILEIYYLHARICYSFLSRTPIRYVFLSASYIKKQSPRRVLWKGEKVKKAPPATSLKKRLWHRCFPVNFAKFLRTSFFTEHLWWLLLYIRPLCLRSHCINNSSKLLLSAHRISYQVVLSSI